MTKYEELCELFSKSKRDITEYYGKMERFVNKLTRELVDYLGCEWNDIELLSINLNETNLERRYHKEKFTSDALNSYGGFLYCGIGVVLKDNYAKESYVFELNLKEDNGVYSVIVKNKKFKITDDFTPLFEYMVEYLKELYKDFLKAFLKGNSLKTTEHYIN